MDFDETRLYYSHQQLQRQDAPQDGEGENNVDAQDDQVDLKAVRRHFREFLRKSCAVLCCVVLRCVVLCGLHRLGVK
jgi:hypothetical protein